ncbi:hypothetical protein ACFQ0K_07875 [Nocardioides caeni]|uniref:Uncharacterized protein n=1 Tax=Nocardioides caeni TaxID=574700 RepID=A0A4S8N569_9ACTN|nr:hypothetical protein [Nocardioides caeni]THV10049.1 hypothetical protein E9934_14625 [Nocardioides caeni]
MSDLMTMLPIYAFMLIPVWIPVIAMTCGALADALRASRDTARGLAHAHPTRVVSAGRPVPAGGTAR